MLSVLSPLRPSSAQEAESCTARVGIVAPWPAFAAAPGGPCCHEDGCSQSPSLRAWSSSSCPIRSVLGTPGNTEPVAAPVAQLHPRGAASPVATRPRPPAVWAPGAWCRPRARLREGGGSAESEQGCAAPGLAPTAGAGGSPMNVTAACCRRSDGLCKGARAQRRCSTLILQQLRRVPGGKSWWGLCPSPGLSLRPVLASPALTAPRPSCVGAH